MLAIEDDVSTAQEIITELGNNGFEVEWADNGRDGLALALSAAHDLITLDRMLPFVDGLTIVTAMRKEGIETPVLMISALSDVDERVQCLRAGGDDYLVKPFASEEMAARVEVLLRRKDKQGPKTILRIFDLQVDLVARTVTRQKTELSLLPVEFRLLEYMVRNYGQVITRTMLFEAVWGYHFDPGTNIIDVHIGRLRKKVDIPGLVPLIHTVRGSGYILSDHF
ncbi:MAG: response regulator transcription factor [Gallionellaceae bacterium]|nr:response regulator transcription factor [Gallionellaceae bacterium]